MSKMITLVAGTIQDHIPVRKKVHIKDGYVSVEKCAPGASGADVVYLRRLHSVHSSNNQFKRLIVFVMYYPSQYTQEL